MRKSDPGPSQPQQTSSLLMKLLTLAFAPAAYMLGLACACASFAIRQVFFLLQLPFTITIISLQLVDAVVSDILVYLTHQPSLSTQVRSLQRSVTSLQQTNQAQHRQILLLQNELDGLKLEKSMSQRKVMELSDKLAASQERVAKLEADTLLPAAKNKAALAAASHAPRAAPGAGTGSLATSRTSNVAPGVVYDAQRWYLHACVALAGLGLRWWLLHQTDPLQQKIMLVVVWPAVWIYGAMLFDYLPRSSTLRSALACFCWALLGYIGHEMVAHSVGEHQYQQHFIHSNGSGATSGAPGMPSIKDFTSAGWKRVPYNFPPSTAAAAQ